MATSVDEDLRSLISVLRGDPSLGEADLYRRALEYFDRIIICRAMDQCGGNLTKAAELLGLSRVTLRTKLRVMRRPSEKTIAPEIDAQCRATGMANPS
jgi:DNA-binding protein Fis